jgi:hypothetical protein
MANGLYLFRVIAKIYLMSIIIKLILKFCGVGYRKNDHVSPSYEKSGLIFV